MRLSGLDLATRKSGWCTGDGSVVPTAGAWIWGQCDDDLGLLCALARQDLNKHIDLYKPDLIGYEAPILVVKGRRGPNGQRAGYTDTPRVLRKLYALGAITELVCRDRGVDCVEVSIQDIKRELTGNARAGKADMVAVAEKCGVRLPAELSAGREDAADGFGAWMVLVRLYAREHQADWDRRIYSSRGALI